MYTQKDKWQRSFVPTTPDYHHKKKRGASRSSIGTAIILISIIMVILLGLWVVTFNSL